MNIILHVQRSRNKVPIIGNRLEKPVLNYLFGRITFVATVFYRAITYLKFSANESLKFDGPGCSARMHRMREIGW